MKRCYKCERVCVCERKLRYTLTDAFPLHVQKKNDEHAELTNKRDTYSSFFFSCENVIFSRIKSTS